MNLWLAVLLFAGPIFVLMGVLRNQKRIAVIRSETVELQVDEFGVRRVLADGRTEGVEWVEVTEVEVLTSNSGPHGPTGGVVIVSGDETHGCLVPIDRLQDTADIRQVDDSIVGNRRRLIGPAFTHGDLECQLQIFHVIACDLV